MQLFERGRGATRRFYRIDLFGNRIHLHHGRHGSEGRHRYLTFDNEELARTECAKLCAERLAEGYREIDDEVDAEQVSRARLAKVAPLSESPRYLFTRKQSFAWVEARGDLLLSARGLREDEARIAPTVRPLGSAAAAAKARDAMVATLLADGFELDTFAASTQAPPVRQPRLADASELERVIAEDPYDDDRWSVLEDWLLEQPDDPRADIIRFAKDKQPGDEAQARGAAHSLLLGEHHEAIVYALTPGTWRAGYLIECVFSTYQKSPAVFAQLVATPAARLLRALVLTGRQRDIANMLRRLAAAPCSSTLRELELRGGDGDPGELTGAPLARLALRRLAISVGTHRLRDVSMVPTLEVLELRLSSTDELGVLTRGSLPRLQRLSLHISEADYAATFGRGPWITALRGAIEQLPNFAPALRELEVHAGTPDTAGVVTAAASALGLQSLTVSPSGAS